jgi:SAM-dependent methyltransferase
MAKMEVLPPPNPSPSLKCCKLCRSSKLKLWRKSTTPDAISSADFAITDNRYGLTFSLYRCFQCGFLQSFEGDGAEVFYRNLVDTAYSEGYAYRMFQVESIFRLARPDLSPAGRLLDIGAANGMLLEYATRQGYAVEGIEPSEWLCQEALSRGIAIHCGTFPDSRCLGPYDIVTAIDVLEHVTDPMAMLRGIRESLSPQGRAILVTPDVSSLVARLMRKKWWHYRIAHLSYFNRITLKIALESSGLSPIRFHRPPWVFSVEYLWQRLGGYFPILKPVHLPSWCVSWVLPINFRDSWLIVVERKSNVR